MDFVLLLMGNPPLGESKEIMFTSLFAFFWAISSNTKKTNKVGEHRELKLGWLRLVSWIACVEETMGRLKISTQTYLHLTLLCLRFVH